MFASSSADVTLSNSPTFLTPWSVTINEVSAEDITTAHNDSTRGDKGFGEGTGNK